MAQQTKPRKRSKKFLAILEKYNVKPNDAIQTVEYKSTYSRRGKTNWYQEAQKKVTQFSEVHEMKKTEVNSLRGYIRRFNNVIEMAKRDSHIMNIMSRRWENSDLPEKFGGKTFQELTKDDISRIAEYTAEYSGVLSLPSVSSVVGKGGATWNS